MEKKNSVLEGELVKAKEDANCTREKLMEVERTCLQLQQNLRRFFFSCSHFVIAHYCLLNELICKLDPPFEI